MYKNPFVETLTVPYIRIVKRDVTAKQMIDGLQDSDFFDVELEESTRVYRNPALCGEMLNLPASALRLTIWIMYNLGRKATSIRLDDKELITVFQCSCRQVLRMRTDLLKAGIIAKKKENEYWTNPRFFSSASRLELYPECGVMQQTIQQR